MPRTSLAEFAASLLLFLQNITLSITGFGFDFAIDPKDPISLSNAGSTPAPIILSTKGSVSRGWFGGRQALILRSANRTNYAAAPPSARSLLQSANEAVPV